MTGQAVRLAGMCRDCQKSCEGWAVQLVKEGRLRWEVEWACDDCGNSHDAGWGPAPDDVRQLILNEYGLYRLRLEHADRPGGKALKAFREALAMTIKQAQGAAAELAADGYRGTFVEVSLVAKLLNKSGVNTTVRPDGSTDT